MVGIAQLQHRWTAALACLLASTCAARADWPTTRPTTSHWAFVAPQRPAVPALKDGGWSRNPIDYFVLDRLQSQGLSPSPEAPKATLLRRVSLDLIGLQPTPAELDAFLNDASADAYEKVVDRLLASPHYGERWGKHWLDAARYGDSNGYSIDGARSMWRYRDWVIDAINRDMPFDEFTIEQIAGDMLPNATLEQKIATGFHRNTQINQEGGIDEEQFRVEAIVDRVNTTGSVFLGLTIGCAQCHNHKFDPIAQADFYRFFAFFNSCDEPELKTPVGDQLKRESEIRYQYATLEMEKQEFEHRIAEKAAAWESTLTGAEKATLGENVRAVLSVAGDSRTKAQRDTIISAFRAASPEIRERDRKLAALKKDQAGAVTRTLVLQERREPRQTHVFIKGDFTRHGDPVTPAVPAILPQIDAPNPTRLDLARWLVDPRNPLTARVTVNRVWQHYFGLGVVETENDFGTQGSGPSNPKLLDWLATELVNRRWSRKAIHRLIVTSATYRQSSIARPQLADVDPYNRLLARQSRVRLDAEIVRDVGLQASGLLCDTVGGPSVFPSQPDGVMGLGQFKREWKTSAGPDQYRRGMYTFLWRSTPHPLLTAFDATNATASCTRRLRSNTPLQALILLNDQACLEFARAMASRVLHEAPPDDSARVDYAFRLAVTRLPEPAEKTFLLQLLNKQLNSTPQSLKKEDQSLAAWTIVARVILNLDEAITRE
ncbi:MAG TPA: DUF1549 and DUF1553 domain-containing protein [Tepidisphaeraceae bacterium]|jgi:hypothetical protein|nr:DUF1549 and DUF1553 domain-containing protein [Tepidisphaeraceae bacterium]